MPTSLDGVGDGMLISSGCFRSFLTQIYEGTNQVQRIMIDRQPLKGIM
jgi:hypothetical protein